MSNCAVLVIKQCLSAYVTHQVECGGFLTTIIDFGHLVPKLAVQLWSTAVQSVSLKF